MPYADHAKQIQYLRNWRKAKRNEPKPAKSYSKLTEPSYDDLQIIRTKPSINPLAPALTFSKPKVIIHPSKTIEKQPAPVARPPEPKFVFI